MQMLEFVRTYRYQTAAVATAAVLVVLGLIFLILTAPVDSYATEREVVIESGMDATDVGLLLQSEGIIRHARVFRFTVRILDIQKSLQAGRYLLCPCDGVLSVVRAISSGDALSTDRVVTIPEGMNGWEVDALLSELGVSEAGQVRSALLEGEGSYFPETYRMGLEESGEDLLERMSDTFRERASDYSSEQVVVASMLEKEAKTAEDMALVAGIIYRRIELGMPLQIDATVAYGWCLRTRGAERSCDVTQAPIKNEIGIDGAYNTYSRGGLPEGPIANPGIKALNASANPKSSEYLFYLSTRDGSRLIFSETNEEHLKNRREHLGF